MMSAKLAKARDAFALQYHADVAQLNALLQYLNENQEELLLKLVAGVASGGVAAGAAGAVGAALSSSSESSSDGAHRTIWVLTAPSGCVCPRTHNSLEHTARVRAEISLDLALDRPAH